MQLVSAFAVAGRFHDAAARHAARRVPISGGVVVACASAPAALFDDIRTKHYRIISMEDDVAVVGVRTGDMDEASVHDGEAEQRG
jgi:hypothetical protein